MQKDFPKQINQIQTTKNIQKVTTQFKKNSETVLNSLFPRILYLKLAFENLQQNIVSAGLRFRGKKFFPKNEDSEAATGCVL